MGQPLSAQITGNLICVGPAPFLGNRTDLTRPERDPLRVEAGETSYLPTERNKLVVDHYSKLGFSQVGEASPDGATRWRQPVDSPEPETPPMKVVLVGLSN